MYRIEWQLSTGERRSRHVPTKEEAASMFNNLLYAEGVVKVLAYERYGAGEQTGWRLLKIGSDGEIVANA